MYQNKCKGHLMRRKKLRESITIHRHVCAVANLIELNYVE